VPSFFLDAAKLIEKMKKGPLFEFSLADQILYFFVGVLNLFNG